ncbi:hypothetical protein KHA80_12205 [Anaerobacillus sp. HL2]|nr:hypothetical protein KHA80_12205 [Anaerobacillus sp. HL2]
MKNETFTIKTSDANVDPERVAAFQDLAAFINQNAKSKKRASFKRAQDDNPKYALRTWLI